MDLQRRNFLAMVSTAVPALAAVPVAGYCAFGGEGVVGDLWEALGRIKSLPAALAVSEAGKLHRQFVELTGYVHDIAHLTGHEWGYALSQKPVSCCVDCLYFGAEPLILLQKAPLGVKHQTVRGNLVLLERDALLPHVCLV